MVRVAAPREACVRLTRSKLGLCGLLGALGGALAASACSADGSGSYDDGNGGNASGSGGVGVGDGVGPGPEEELEENFRAPVVAGPYLFSANPETNRVALIDARTLATKVFDAGHAPTYLIGVPEGATGGGALVINALGGDASFFEITGTSGAEPTVKEQTVGVQPGASGWAVSRTGRFAIAWSRVTDGLLGPTDGYQDFTVIALSNDGLTGTRLAAGFRPTRVSFDDAETRAYVVSADGLSVIDLESSPPTRLRDIFLPEQDPALGRDVTVTPNGRLALVRLPESKDLLIVETETGTTVTMTLPEEVTDVDLAASGGVAVAVMRGEAPSSGTGGSGGTGSGGTGLGGAGLGGETGGGGVTNSSIAIFDIEEAFVDPTAFDLLETSELVGSVVVAGNASHALLFTNATPVSRASILDIEAQTLRAVDLKAPARAGFLSPKGESGVMLMTPPTGSKKAGAFALVPIGGVLPPRIEGTLTEPRYVSLTESRALITTEGGSAAAEVFLGRFPTLIVDQAELPSTPLSSGLVPEANQGFVSQEHPEGRVTFVDLESAEARTKTGFELASEVTQ